MYLPLALPDQPRAAEEDDEKDADEVEKDEEGSDEDDSDAGSGAEDSDDGSEDGDDDDVRLGWSVGPRLEKPLATAQRGRVMGVGRERGRCGGGRPAFRSPP